MSWSTVKSSSDMRESSHLDMQMKRQSTKCKWWGDDATEPTGTQPAEHTVMTLDYSSEVTSPLDAMSRLRLFADEGVYRRLYPKSAKQLL